MQRLSTRAIGWLLVLVACAATLPPLAQLPSAGLDPSWELGLHLAHERGHVVGRDIIFNYGPWGHLNFPLTLVRSQWLAAAAHALSVHVALFLLVGLWMQRHLTGWRRLLPIVPLVLFAPGLEYQWPLALALALRLALGTREERPWIALVVGAVGSIALLIKFSMGLAAALVVGGGVTAAWMIGRRMSALLLASGYAAGLVGWGLAAFGSAARLATFLSTSWEISSGYVLALERRGPSWQPILVVAACLALVAGMLHDRRRQPRALLALALPLAGLLAVSFKHAFVRHETHSFIAFSVGSVALLWTFLETADRGAPWSRALRGLGPAALCCAALVVIPPAYVTRLPRTASARLVDFTGAFRDTRDPGHRERLRADLRRQLPLPEGVLEAIGDRTVDVLTTEVALVEAWDLNWRPRPVLQSYAVGTSRLDDLDASFFSSERAPQRLLVDLQGVDTRHPFMDGPGTWRQILSRYEPLGHGPRWLVLALRDAPRRAVETPLVEAPLELNRPALIPRPQSGHLELRVHLEPSWLGRLVAVPWKLPEIRLALLSPEPQPPRRILAGTADRLFPITRAWPESPAQLGRMFDADDLAAPEAIALVTNGRWAWKDARVRFVRVDWDERTAVPPTLPAAR